jgi:hypothetical protein
MTAVVLLLIASNIALWGAVVHLVRGGNRTALDLMSCLTTGKKAPGAGDYRIPYVLYTLALSFVIAAGMVAFR